MTYNERATRKKLIDQALASAGWAPIQPYENRVRYEQGAVEEFPSAPAGKALTLDQEKWLDLTRALLVENLAIDREDFELMTFTRAGGSWGRVNRDFGGNLEMWLIEINQAIAE